MADETKKSSDTVLPNFPALCCCVLIDARHSSRTELIKYLKASGLFEDVLEARSLSDGLTMLTRYDVDACFFGPSVTVDRCQEFIKKVADGKRSLDCAIVAVVSDPEVPDAVFLDRGAHGVIKKPCTRQRFTEAVIRAVVRANANSPWVSLAKEIFGDTLEIGTVKVVEKAAEEPLHNAMYAATIATSAERMKCLAAEIDRGMHPLNSTGSLPKNAEKALRDIMVEILAASAEQPQLPAVEEFHEFFENALKRWFFDCVNSSQAQATDAFRRCLLEFVPNQLGVLAV